MKEEISKRLVGAILLAVATYMAFETLWLKRSYATDEVYSIFGMVFPRSQGVLIVFVELVVIIVTITLFSMPRRRR